MQSGLRYQSVLLALPGLMLAGLLGAPEARCQPVSELLADSRVVAVVVYKDRALVTRRAEQSFKAGVQRLIFQDLPAALQLESLRVSGRGEGKVTIQGRNVSSKSLAESHAMERERMEEEIAALEMQLREVNDTQETLEESLEDLRELGRGLSTWLLSQFPDTDAESLNGVLPLEDGISTETGEFPGIISPFGILSDLQQHRSKIREELRELQPKQVRLQQQIDERRKELVALGALAETEGYEVTVDLSMEKQGRAEIDLIYVINGASWQPFYDIRYLEDEKKLAVAYQALVKQRTGEDWQDVALELSTARPQSGGRPRDLQPWVLRQRPEVQRSRDSVAQESTQNGPEPPSVEANTAPESENGDEGESEGELFTFGSRTTDLSDAGALALTTDVVGDGAESSFTIQHPVSIKSGETEVKVSITDLTFDAAVNRLSRPSLDAYAYLRAETTNTSDVVLLGGRTNVFLGGNFLSTSEIDTIMPEQPVEIFLGQDPNIIVRRERVKLKPGSPGLIFPSGQVDMRYNITITIENHSEDTLELTVEDRIPVSLNPDIEISLRESEPRVSSKRNGICTWRVPIKAESKQTIVYEYRVRHPKGELPDGL